MDINDAWSGLLAIYQRAIPAVFLTAAFFAALRLSCPDLTLRQIVSSNISRAMASGDVKDFGKLIRLLRLSALVPLFFILSLLAYLIIVADFSAWFARAMPGPLRTSYTPIDLVAEQRSPEDLFVMAAHLQSSREAQHSLDRHRPFPRLSDIMFYYAREEERLSKKYPGRFEIGCNEDPSVAALYGGFLLLSLLFFGQLGLRKWRPSKLWFRHTTGWRTLFVVIVLLFITGYYRLRWEWSTEKCVTSRFRATADALQEERPVPTLSPGILRLLEEQMRNDKPRRFWLARHYEVFTKAILSKSDRQL